jgi:hypothetical protein
VPRRRLFSIYHKADFSNLPRRAERDATQILVLWQNVLFRDPQQRV